MLSGPTTSTRSWRPSRWPPLIGAGASFDLGIPIGQKLKSDIGKRLEIEFDGFRDQTSGDRKAY
jgi:hypothetical protein